MEDARGRLSQVIKLASQLSKCDKDDNRFNQSRITCFDVHGYPSWQIHFKSWYTNAKRNKKYEN